MFCTDIGLQIDDNDGNIPFGSSPQLGPPTFAPSNFSVIPFTDAHTSQLTVLHSELLSSLLITFSVVALLELRRSFFLDAFALLL